MAREAQDRENLLRDAKAFVTRVQLSVPIDAKHSEVFVGFRTGGAVSYYFDQDPVYHFNDRGALRRAFVDDRLIKTEQGRLVELQRQNGENQVTMLRHVMTEKLQRLFCQSVWQQLDLLRQTIASGDFSVEGQVVPAGEASALDRLRATLKQLSEIQVAATPNVSG